MVLLFKLKLTTINPQIIHSDFEYDTRVQTNFAPILSIKMLFQIFSKILRNSSEIKKYMKISVSVDGRWRK